MIFSIRDSGIVWADAGLDLTTEVVKRLDAANAGTTASAPAPAPAATLDADHGLSSARAGSVHRSPGFGRPNRMAPIRDPASPGTLIQLPLPCLSTSPIVLDRLCYRYPSPLVDAITEHEPGRASSRSRTSPSTKNSSRGIFPARR